MKNRFLYIFNFIAFTMRVVIVFSLLCSSVSSFAPSSPSKFAATLALSACADESIDRRSVLTQSVGATLTTASLLVTSSFPSPALAADDRGKRTIAVAGATGQTGRRVLERLANTSGLKVIGGVRNVDKASKSLAEDSTVVRGAMIQKVGSVDTAAVVLQHIDVVQDSVDQMAEVLQGTDGLVIATGFVPGNPLKMNEAAHAVDNIGTCKLVDAAKKAGVKKIVMVSSILTNGPGWGQEKSPGYIVTNAFGKVLEEKLVAEKYLRAVSSKLFLEVQCVYCSGIGKLLTDVL
jgi:putative NADH-flavin reductase